MSVRTKARADLSSSAIDLDRLETALWTFDFDAGRIVWANRAALRLWNADSSAALARRDMSGEMSPSVAQRLSQHRQDFEVFPARVIREFWTFYPDGSPFRVSAVLRRHDFPDGRVGMLVEARAEDLREPETIRSADALLHTPVMTALFDQDGLELYANPAFREALGPGRHCFGREFASVADRAAFLDGLKRRAGHRAVVPVRTAKGARWHDVHALKCRDAVTGDGAFLVSAIDVTAAQEHEKLLKTARDAAEAADRAKSQFLATMSHEMRTPLNGVLGMASLLAQTELAPKQKEFVELISDSGDRLLSLVEDVLEIVRLDAGAISLRKERFDPEIVLRSAVEASRDEAEAKGLSLAMSVEHSRARAYHHDASRIRQVLRHLLSNAVKFTAKGAILARVCDDGASGLRFEVVDSGPGIDASDHSAIFQRFHQLDGSSTRRHGGAGLGLAISRELVTLFGGEIGVTSEPGAGSTFWFTVPDASAT